MRKPLGYLLHAGIVTRTLAYVTVLDPLQRFQKQK